MRLRAAEKERLLNLMDTSYFNTLEGRVRQRVLRTSADQMFWNKDSSDLLKSFGRFFKDFFWQNGGEFEKFHTRCIFGACGAAQLQQGVFNEPDSKVVIV